MLDKINLYFTKQTISQCVFIDLFDHFYASVFIFDGLKDELMQGRPDPVLKCPEQAQSDRKPSGIVSLVIWFRTSLCEHFCLPPLLRFRSNSCFFFSRCFFHGKFFVLSSDHNKSSNKDNSTKRNEPPSGTNVRQHTRVPEVYDGFSLLSR